MVRKIFAGIGGILAGNVFNLAVIFLSWAIFPLPEGTDPSNPESLATYIKTLPVAAFLLILVAHAGGSFVGGAVAALIARQAQLMLGGIVGIVFLLAGIMNAVSIPAPLWFVIVDLLLYVPAGILGALLCKRAFGKSSIE